MPHTALPTASPARPAAASGIALHPVPGGSARARIGLAARQAQRGLSHVEGLIVLSVAAVLLGAALPSFEKARERRQLEGAAAQLRTAVMHARSLATTLDRPVRLRVETTTSGSCYVVHSGPAQACSCSQGPDAVCTPGARSFQMQQLPASGGVVVSTNASAMLFDPTLGTVTPTGTLSLRGKSGAEVRQIVSVMGRVRACSPNGVTGYPAC